MKDKAVDCIRVDGAGDEGPSHHEVQFYWTERNFLLGKKATIVTTTKIIYACQYGCHAL